MQTISKNSKPDISCIYVNYRSAELLDRSLASLFQHEQDTSYEIIIINNDQNEQRELEDIAKKFEARIIPAFHNPGFGTSANTGVQESTGQLLFFINPDTKWKEPFFKNVQEKFFKMHNLGALGIQLISRNGQKETQKRKGALQFPFRLYPGIRDYAWVSGGALFVKKEAFTRVGGFDERFFMYFEDMDLCVRLQQAGNTVLLEDKHELIHYGGQSHTSKKSQKRIYDRSLYQYTKKHWSLPQHFLFHVMHLFYRFLFPYGRS